MRHFSDRLNSATRPPVRTIFLALALALSACKTKLTAPEPGLVLVWADEFEKEGLPDPALWTYDVGGSGWGNNELQYYTQGRLANARVEAGKLIIEAHQEAYENREYSSSRLITRGKHTWNEGRIEARAKLPTGRGTWPAIWMLGENIQELGWPHCGEIDIMEHVGYEPDSVFASIHCQAFNHVAGTQKTKGIELKDAEQQFHQYGIDWNRERILFLLDGKEYFRFERPSNASLAEWPFDTPHYLLLNLAVGGNWGGKHGVDTTIWPQRMEVDWVRVWQRKAG